MTKNTAFEDFVLDQITGFVEFETKRMFGGIALLHQGKAFAKIKHEKLWLKVDEVTKTHFKELEMRQYSYGKGGARKLNFYETPAEYLEDRDRLIDLIQRTIHTISKLDQ